MTVYHQTKANLFKRVSPGLLAFCAGMISPSPIWSEGVDKVIHNLSETGDLKISYAAQLELLACSSNATAPKAEAAQQKQLEQDMIKALPTATPWVKLVLLRQCALMGTDQCVEAVKACFKEDELHLRDEARNTLQHLGSDKALAALLEEMPKAKNETELLGFIQTLGTFQKGSVVPILANMLNHKDAQVVFAAIRALGKLESSEAHALLLKSRTSASAELKNEVDLALLSQKSLSQEDAKTIFLNSTLGVAKVAALQILCAKNPNDASLIKSVLAEKEPKIKAALLKGCAQNPQVCDRLIQEESQFSDLDVVAIFSGLCASNNTSKEDWILKYVTSEQEVVKVAAMRALSLTGSSKSLLPLMSLISDKNGKIKDAALEALQNLRGSDFTPILNKKYEEGDLQVKNSVLQALAYCVIPNGNELCIKMIESQESFQNKNIALQTLCVIGGLAELKKLTVWINNSQDENELRFYTGAAKKIFSKLKGDKELEELYNNTIKDTTTENKKEIFKQIFEVAKI